MAKVSSFGSAMRKKLSDITNTNLSNGKIECERQENLSPASPTTKAYIDKLFKEKNALMRLIEERNKLIELSGAELQKVRINLQKMQLQNWNLAQANSHMLAELNLGKSKLKTLQHELVCKEATLKAKKLKLENGVAEVVEGLHQTDKKLGNEIPRRVGRSQSMVPSIASQAACGKSTTEVKGHSMRRRSTRLNPDEEPAENLFEIEDLKLSTTEPLDGIKHEDGQNLSRRSSIGRPSRRAAQKVPSYKEVPLNVKMRRTE